MPERTEVISNKIAAHAFLKYKHYHLTNGWREAEEQMTTAINKPVRPYDRVLKKEGRTFNVGWGQIASSSYGVSFYFGPGRNRLFPSVCLFPDVAFSFS